MLSISKHEYLQLLKSIKSILVILFLLGVTYGGIQLTEKFQGLLIDVPTDTDAMYSVGISFALLSFGPLFVFSLSHDVFNREISGRMMRFIVTKTKRSYIVLGKFIGVSMFWLSIVIASFGLIFVFTQSFDAKVFFETLSVVSVFIGMALVLSLLISRPMLSMFLGVLIGIVYPAISVWSIFSSFWAIKWFKFFSPYYYISVESYLFLVNFGMAALLFIVSVFLFKRRDL
ncbi:hypothetical protein [Psychrobacillus sp. NPDC096389]|uniref:hypothetical protein n=1 Tax=Psychrobacillus sp. NPDC096389 TaxID=3364490 RepID=UPI0037F2F477